LAIELHPHEAITMKNSAQKIRTTHVGKLPTPVGFHDMALRLASGQATDSEVTTQVVPIVADAIKRQVAIGIDCVGDGEYWAGLGQKWYDQQMSGLSTRPLKPGEVAAMRESTRERDVFRTLYADMDRVGTIACIPGERPIPPARERVIVSGPVKSKGTAVTQRQLECFKAAIARAGVAVDEAFVPALAPGWLDHFIYNEYYKTDEEFVYALANAMSDKYHAIVDAGFVLQIDDPGIATSWDMIKPQPSMADYRKYITLRIEALNHALKGIPAEKVRYHFCWGSWHGAHVNDIPLTDIVDIALSVNAQTCSFEAANVRHEHEIAVWNDVKLAPGTILMPGVISHATNIVEHPALVARRLVDFAAIVGRENVVAGADCGMGGRVHGEIGWAKLAALTEGAALASKTLWRH
jgi:5-methyltetrahydropteroyltriglutamate--homocysteine methyltransferase